jgi:CHAT domain-containing protein
VLGAERELAADFDPARSGTGLLVLGDPDFEAVDTEGRAAAVASSATTETVFRGQAPPCEEFAKARWVRLPGSEQEIEEIAKIWGKEAPLLEEGGKAREPVVLRSGGGASEQSLKQEAPGRRVLHVATHGFSVEEACVSADRPLRGMGALVAAGRSDAPAEVGAPRAGNPLLLSGLVLAGANQRAASGSREDGILTAEEVASLDLRGVEWAVLSACGTGVGEVRTGEGVFGLHRAFREAGVGATIMSLWPVADEPTRKWMRSFYAGKLEHRLAMADAVQRATLDALATARKAFAGHPFYWAGFVAAGEWR